ncbi:transcription antitermination factor NusB [Candidatus Igneacidithiobacillus taiwanensis]|uniref:transcription antitermination factor NusB n=1 Tax=Candidatus Igneacidithiobacillus taiwanensis TaxID=1945924 RepID=UPI0028991680|nr:transcription antitermination factor NusB [Candidatus Igneacidithiobacillus taiwanensis]
MTTLRTPSRRRLARVALVQALYQLQINPTPCGELMEQFHADPERLEGADMAFFDRLWPTLCAQIESLDPSIAAALNDRRWREEVNEVERAILRLAAFELRYELQTPMRVILNEAIELDKAFGAEQGHRFINGVLDQLARRWRRAEIVGVEEDAAKKL